MHEGPRSYRNSLELPGTLRRCHGNLDEAPAEERYPSGALLCRGVMRGTMRVGTWRWFFPDGAPMRDLTYADGTPSGPWVEYADDGTRWIEQTFARGKLDGTRTTYGPNGRVVERSRWRNGAPDGPWEIYDAGGAVEDRLEFARGTIAPDPPAVPIGWWQQGPSVCPAGTRLDGVPPPRGNQVRCVDGAGRAEGPYAAWGVRGEFLRQGIAAAGKERGLWTSWHDEHRISRQVQFDEPHGRRIEWDSLGVLRELIRIRGPDAYGAAAIFGVTGALAILTDYRDGQRTLVMHMLDPSGEYGHVTRHGRGHTVAELRD
jgi:antitoxin component YwqK of YwqJK toxin-antitoxin module